jgi:signal transduction histidine kinase
MVRLLSEATVHGLLRRSLVASLMVACLGAALLPAAVVAAPPLATADAVAAATAPADVDLEAVVSFQDSLRTIFLADDTGVTFIYAPTNPLVAPGDRLRVRGRSHEGVMIGGIEPAAVGTIGKGAPPPPRPIGPDELRSGRWHYHVVEMTGVVRDIGPDGEAGAEGTLTVSGQRVDFLVEKADATFRDLVDARVTIRGLAAGDVNDRRQIVRPYIRVKRLADFEVLDRPPADPFARPALPVAEFQRANLDDRRLKLVGTAVAAPIAGGVFLRQAGRSVFVETKAEGIRGGDTVEAVGFPEMGPYSLYLADAQCRVTGSGPAPAPRLDLRIPFGASLDGELVRFDGRIVQRLPAGDRTELVVAADGKRFTVIVPPGVAVTAGEDAVVRVTGVCRVAAVQGDRYRAMPEAYTVWLSVPDDLVVLSRPSWWTPRRITIAAGVAAAAAAACGVWVALLRRQVRRQVRIIEGTLQAQAVADERRRIAREFHDTLEQGLAAVALRLDAAVSCAEDEPTRRMLDQQRQLLAGLQEETRDFLWDLREPVLAGGMLADALRSQVAYLQSLTSVPIACEATGAPPTLPTITQYHLVRIAREAAINAVKYAHAGRIAIRLETKPDGAANPAVLVLRIADDGTGFDLADRGAADGHFGIQGMRERAKRIGAEVRIDTAPGRGTTVTVALPLADQGSDAAGFVSSGATALPLQLAKSL